MKEMEAGALFHVNPSWGIYFASGTSHEVATLSLYSPHFSVICSARSTYLEGQIASMSPQDGCPCQAGGAGVLAAVGQAPS